MKKKLYNTIALSLITSFLFLSTSYAAKNNIQQVKTIKPVENHSIGYNLGRGTANILLGWFELPRQMVYQGSKVPFFGLISGAAYGVCVTFWRACSGVTDILSLGFGGGDIYFFQGLPEFPWQGYWVSEKSKQDAAKREAQATKS